VSTCASLSSALAEPVTATAATARTWLLLEQPGPWGAKALTASHLGPGTGRALERAAEGTGVRVALIRRPGRHAALRRPSRRVFVAHTLPGRSWVRTAELEDPAALLGVDFTALGRGDHQEFGQPYEGEPLALVCTNGKRDQCCALYGRPLAAELDTWETTHLGGHRFSPTMLVLPYGYAYGRLDARRAKETLSAAAEGRVERAGCRGRSAWDRPGQAAELAVRSLTGEDRAEALTVVAAVSHPPRPESCGAALGTPARMNVTGIRAVAVAEGR